MLQVVNDINLATLETSQGFQIYGTQSGIHFTQDPGGSLGFVTVAGDLNNDGVADVVVGAPSETSINARLAGNVYVLFGPQTGENIDLQTMVTSPNTGFKIFGAMRWDQTGSSVRAAGDVNNDGVDDIIIAAPGNTDGNGLAYVIYGRNIPNGAAAFTDIDLLTMVTGPTTGFKITGVTVASGASYGISIGCAGDINADGFADLIVGASGNSPLNRAQAGSAFVIFGNANHLDVNVLYMITGPTTGFRIYGATANEYVGYTVSGAGDVNGDGVDDFVVGSEARVSNQYQTTGFTYVIFGNASADAYRTDMDLLSWTTSASSGFRLYGEILPSVSSAGDFNNDGVRDIVVGAPQYVAVDRSSPTLQIGKAYVVFGRDVAHGAAPLLDLNLTSMVSSPVTGLRITCFDRSLSFISEVRHAGDVNGDGIDDVILGAKWMDPTAEGTGAFYRPGNRQDAGISYVLYGSASAAAYSADLDVTSWAQVPSDRGYRILGNYTSDMSGCSVSGAGDFNLDGVGDLIIGAAGASPPGRPNAGKAYVIYGNRTAAAGTPTAQPTQLSTPLSTRIPTHVPTHVPTTAQINSGGSGSKESHLSRSGVTAVVVVVVVVVSAVAAALGLWWVKRHSRRGHEGSDQSALVNNADSSDDL